MKNKKLHTIIALVLHVYDTVSLQHIALKVEQHPAATSVHALRPNDIRVMAAFGDSITAGNGLGAATAPGVAIENRGESWSVGGNQSIATILSIPNLIKQFNPDVTGWSWSRCAAVVHIFLVPVASSTHILIWSTIKVSRSFPCVSSF